MRRTEALQGVRMTVFLTLLHRWESAELNQEEAAELLGVSERTFRRWTRRYEEDGEAGLLDRRLGKASGKRVPVDRAEEVERLYRERYQGFTVKPFHEHLVKDHGFGWGYTWTKLHLQWAGVVAKAPRKGAHRRKRERRPLPGMMLHQSLPPRRLGTARGTNGSRASPHLISLSRSMMRRGRSIRRFSSRRRARPRPSGRSKRCSRSTACR
jgi:transposase